MRHQNLCMNFLTFTLTAKTAGMQLTINYKNEKHIRSTTKIYREQLKHTWIELQSQFTLLAHFLHPVKKHFIVLVLNVYTQIHEKHDYK